MLIYSHRGYSGKYPENTMIAFEEAIQAGSDGIELDVQMTSDGSVVIFHDENLERVTGTKALLKDVSYDSLPYTQVGNHPIPLLSEYLSWVRTKDIITNIEIKSAAIYYPGLEEKVASLVRQYRVDERILISSFNPLSLLRTREYAPHLKLAFLVERYGFSGFDHLCSSFGFEYFHPDISIVTEELVASFHRRGIHVNTYTVDTVKDAHVAQMASVDGIFTNEPVRIREFFTQKENR
ncbi:MAG: glycerophosphodiester phosphodiesterase [Sphaerochaetaceae bacterium]|nr:glycerophosphodiester phosphodiesterase [Sphaerochaetaceae bacterium]